nr:contractile injection system tape measure protein [uncultured Pseudomonas sp.]
MYGEKRGSSVGCIRVRLCINSSLKGDVLLLQTSSLFNNVLIAGLDEILVLSPPLKIDRLVIKLGTLNLSSWEVELQARLYSQLRQQVSMWQEAHLESDVLQDSNAANNESSKYVYSADRVDNYGLPETSEELKEYHYLPNVYLASSPAPYQLAQTLLQPVKLRFWFNRLSSITLNSIVTVLAQEARVDNVTRANLAAILPLSALVYLQRHPQIPVPNPPATLQTLPVAIDVTTLRTWLPRLLAYPLRVEVRQWLHLLCSTAEAKTCLAESLVSIIPTQLSSSLSPIHSGPLELPLASAQPTPRPEPPIRINAGMTWPIHEAGLVLLWPLLPSLFKKMGLLEDQQWVQPESNFHALRCLQALVWGEGPLLRGEDWPDSALLRWLCGMPIGLPLAVPDGFEDNPHDLTELDAWLARPPTAPLDNWSDFTLAELRERFLQRPGKLSLQGGQWSLEIELEPGAKTPPPVPWPVSVLSYPWLTQPLYLSFYEATSVG